MKKRLLILFAALPCAAMALVSGEKASATVGLDYVTKGDPLYLDQNSFSSREPFAHLRVVTLFGTYIPNVRETLTAIDRLAGQYADHDLQALAVSPQPKKAIEDFMSDGGFKYLKVACDKDGRLANTYLDGALVGVRSYIVDASQIILWDGDPDDLPRVLDSMYSNRFNASNSRAVSAWQQEMTIAAASGQNPEVFAAADRILKIDPQNSLALKSYLYAAQYLSTPADTFKYLEELKNANPDSRILYWAMLSQCQNDPELREAAWPLIEEFGRRFSWDADELGRLLWGTLNIFPLEAGALKAAGTLIRPLECAEKPTADIMAAQALYASRIGRLREAVALQKKAVELSDEDGRPTMLRFLDYYTAGLEASEGKAE